MRRGWACGGVGEVLADGAGAAASMAARKGSTRLIGAAVGAEASEPAWGGSKNSISVASPGEPVDASVAWVWSFLPWRTRACS